MPEANPATKIQILRMQNISKDNFVCEPEKAILVEGSVSGHVFAKNIKIWRTQKGIISATSKIFIEKEIIGAERDFDEKSLEINLAKKIFPKDDIMYISAPDVTIGKADEEASVSKKIIISTNRLVLKNVTILDKLTVVLAKESFDLKRQIESDPKKIQNRLNVLLGAIEADIEDFDVKSKRPGNENVRPLCLNLASIMKSTPDNRGIIISLLKKIMEGLTIVNRAEIEERWTNRFELAEKLKKSENKLKNVFSNLSKLLMHLTITEIKRGAELIISYDNNEHIIRGPVKNKTYKIIHKLEDDMETGLKKSALEILTE